LLKQAVRARPHDMLPPLYAAAQLQPYTPYYACGAQRTLLPVAMGTMNIHHVRDRRQTDRRQTSDSIIA